MKSGERLPPDAAIAIAPASVGAELRRSWPTLLTVVFAMFVTQILPYSFSIFIGPLHRDLGWTTTQITGWSMAWSCGCIVAAPVAGLLADRFGAKPVAVLSLILLGIALGCVGLFAASLPAFYFGAFCVGAIMSGSGVITYGRIVSGHFSVGLGTALGFMSSGIGLSAMLGPRFLQSVTDGFGWRWGYGASGIAVLLAVPIIIAFTRETRRPAGSHSDGLVEEGGVTVGQAMCRPVFWALAGGALLYGTCVGGATVNMVPFLTSVGLDRAEAASALGLFGVATVCGRFFTGIIIDRSHIHAALLMALVLIAEGLAFATMGLTGGKYLVVALPIFGLAVGAEADCLAYCTVRIFGRRSYGVIFGFLGLTMLYLGSGVGAMLFSAAQEALGAYRVVFLIWSALATIAAALLVSVSRHPYLPSSGPVAHS